MLKNESLIFANFFYLFKENLLIFQSLCNIKNNSYLILLNTLPPPIFTYIPPFTYFIITLPNISSFFFFPFSRSMLCTPLSRVILFCIIFIVLDFVSALYLAVNLTNTNTTTDHSILHRHQFLFSLVRVLSLGPPSKLALLLFAWSLTTIISTRSCPPL